MFSTQKSKKLVLFVTVILVVLGTFGIFNAQAQDVITIGLITKTETNPFFVKMREGAQAAADKAGVKLITASGKSDSDNDSQVTAIENMVNAGVKGILLVPAVSAAIVPTVQKAREAGVLVIALDTPTDPDDAVDALFATDNFKAGLLIGQYAKAALGDKPVKIATLDADPGNKTGVLRHNGFLEGFGIKDGDPSIVCSGDSGGDQAKGQTLMENCLTKDPDINLVYAINEPAAAGGYTALDKAGLAEGVMIVAVDGGCSPGIAGIILTIGMGVDSNVLIFERIREELRQGKPVRLAVDSGYDKALLTIVDSHVTTLITGLVLFLFGTGPIKGFAVTLCLGIGINLFTALVGTKVVFDWMNQRRKVATLSI